MKENKEIVERLRVQVAAKRDRERDRVFDADLDYLVQHAGQGPCPPPSNLAVLNELALDLADRYGVSICINIAEGKGITFGVDRPVLIRLFTAALQDEGGDDA